MEELVFLHIKVGPNKKKRMFQVTGLKILGRVGTPYIFFNYFS